MSSSKKFFCCNSKSSVLFAILLMFFFITVVYLMLGRNLKSDGEDSALNINLANSKIILESYKDNFKDLEFGYDKLLFLKKITRSLPLVVNPNSDIEVDVNKDGVLKVKLKNIGEELCQSTLGFSWSVGWSGFRTSGLKDFTRYNEIKRDDSTLAYISENECSKADEIELIYDDYITFHKKINELRGITGMW